MTLTQLIDRLTAIRGDDEDGEQGDVDGEVRVLKIDYHEGMWSSVVDVRLSDNGAIYLMSE